MGEQMKTKKTIRIVILAFLIFITGLISPMEKSQASQKYVVELIKVKTKTNGAKEVKTIKHTSYSDKNMIAHEVITATNKKGKVLWKYKCALHPSAQYSSTTMCVKKNKVYIMDGNLLIIKKKNSGKTLKRMQLECYGNGAVTVDKKGNIYVLSADGGDVFKFSSKGRILWYNQDLDGGGGYKLKLKKGRVQVYFDYCNFDYAVLDKKTGELITYVYSKKNSK